MRPVLNSGMRQSTSIGSRPLSYLASRSQSDKHLIFIHGWGGSAQYFADALTALSDTFVGYAPDLPGFGQSTPLNNDNHSDELPYSHRGLARIMIQFMDALDIRQCDVVGHSYGCGVAIALAAMLPQRVGRIVLSNFSTFRDERERRVVSMMHHVTGLMMLARKMPFARTDTFARSFGTRYFHQLPDDPHVLRGCVTDFLGMDEVAARLTVRDSLGWETLHDMKTLTQPVLSIQCRQDQIMPTRNAEFTASLPPHGELAWIDNCGHLPMIEQPAEWLRLIRRFLC